MSRGIFLTGTDTGVSALTRGRAAASRGKGRNPRRRCAPAVDNQESMS